MKSCPFSKNPCSPDCALYIDPDLFNETVRNKLSSIGVLSRDEGMCSYKSMALCMNRTVFEKSLSGF